MRDYNPEKLYHPSGLQDTQNVTCGCGIAHKGPRPGTPPHLHRTAWRGAVVEADTFTIRKGNARLTLKDAATFLHYRKLLGV